MNLRTALLALAVAGALAGCNPGREAADRTADNVEKNVESNVEAAMGKARRQLAEGDIALSGRGNAPKAAITPKGDLVIDGTPVQITEEQRAMLLEYRAQVADVASAGMDVGVQGARLAAKAVSEAVRGVLGGDPEGVEKRVDAHAEPIRQAALRLCDRLPAMMETQQKLAAALPAFAPYATMDASDIEDCRRDVQEGRSPSAPTPPAAPDAPPAPDVPG